MNLTIANAPSKQPVTVDTGRAAVQLIGDEDFCHAWRQSCLRLQSRYRASNNRISSENENVSIIICGDGHERVRALAEEGSVAIVASELTAALAAEMGPCVYLLPPPRDEHSRDLALERLLFIAEGAALRKVHYKRRRLIELGADARVDLSERTIKIGSRVEPLAAGELAIIRFLLDREGHWVSTEALGESVFGRTDAACSTLVWKYISRLRKKLAPHGHLIEGARTRGYRVQLTEGPVDYCSGVR